MKKITITLVLDIVLLCLNVCTYAQKLPNVQTASMLAPADSKADGKTSEWAGQYQAYNKATRIFYTMANTTDKLLLAVHATDPSVINKILAGGVTLSISGIDKKSPQQLTTITFPVVPTADRSGIIYKLKDPEFNIEQGLTDLNHELANSAKEIQIVGVKDLTDTLVSIYNTYDVKAVAAIDTKRELTYELSFPLKYIQQHIDNEGAFKYDIKLNGMGIRAMTQVTINGKSVSINSPEAQQAFNMLSTGNFATMTVSSSGRTTMQSGSSTQDLYNQTDFNGTYTLAK